MSPISIPPPSPYGTFHGSLFQYQTFPSLVAFESIPSRLESQQKNCPNKCILIGGLSDGLIPTPYTKDLEAACHDIGWSLVQPILSSSYLGFGHGTLKRDTEEIGSLMNYLIHHRQAEQFALVGHSTGCQNSVHFLKYGDAELMKRVKVIALQAPVSDREGAMEQLDYEMNIQHARKLQEQGREDEMMPRSCFWAPITAARFLSLQDIGGDDDFFSSDLGDDELSIKLKHIGQRGGQTGLKALVAFSGEDEYVPASVDKDLLLQRLCAAMNVGCENGDTTAIPLMIPSGNHNLSNEEGDKEVFVAAVRDLLKRVI